MTTDERKASLALGLTDPKKGTSAKFGAVVQIHLGLDVLYQKLLEM